jgi:hypothetical protein
MNELKKLKDLPFCPVGSAYYEKGWQPTVAEINEFDAAAQTMKCVGDAWWVWDAPMGILGHPDFKEAISAHNWGTTPIPPIEPRPAFEYLDKKTPVINVPYHPQVGPGANAHHNDCGAASSVMLVDAYTGKVVPVDVFYDKTGVTGDAYLSAQQLIDTMRTYGVDTSWKILDLPTLYKNLVSMKPMIALIKYGVLQGNESKFTGPHFMVVISADIENVYVHDPLWVGEGGKARIIPINSFMEAWREVGTDPAVPNPSYGAIVPNSPMSNFKLTFPIVGM